RFAASGWPKTPKTPQWSWKWSSAKLKSLLTGLPCSRSSFADAQALLKRVRPGVAQSFDRGLDDGVPPLFDAEAIAGDPAYFAGRQAVLSGHCEHGGKVFRRNRTEGASGTFPNDGVV